MTQYERLKNASRQIRENEIKVCAANGVTDIIEVRVGYDGIVFASQKTGPEFNAFEASDWFNALSPMIVKDGALVQKADIGEDCWLVLNQTPFYSESGGQVGDQGGVTADGGKADVADVQKKQGVFAHHP